MESVSQFLREELEFLNDPWNLAFVALLMVIAVTCYLDPVARVRRKWKKESQARPERGWARARQTLANILRFIALAVLGYYLFWS
jgi:small-conductance mechanosensitive channel